MAPRASEEEGIEVAAEKLAIRDYRTNLGVTIGA